MPDNYLLGDAIYTKLAANGDLITALGGTAIWEAIAPSSQSYPYVIFQWQGGGDENMTPSRMVNEVWTVKAICDVANGSKAKAEAVAKEIDEALVGQFLTVTGWTNFWLAREQSVKYAETDEAGEPIWHIGAMFRIRLGS